MAPRPQAARLPSRGTRSQGAARPPPLETAAAYRSLSSPLLTGPPPASSSRLSTHFRIRSAWCGFSYPGCRNVRTEVQCHEGRGSTPRVSLVPPCSPGKVGRSAGHCTVLCWVVLGLPERPEPFFLLALLKEGKSTDRNE